MSAAPDELRIDKLLWYLRLSRTRGVAQTLVVAGHVRCNGARVIRAAHPIVAGDVLTVPLGQSVRVIRIDALPHRRGPQAEAQACYRALDDAGAFPIAAGKITAPEGSPLP